MIKVDKKISHRVLSLVLAVPKKWLFLVTILLIFIFANYSNDFFNYLKTELFRENPIPKNAQHLKQYRTGYWSWDITPIILSYKSGELTTEELIEVMENSFSEVYEYNRYPEEEARKDKEKQDINKYYLDKINTDRVRYFVKDFWAGNSTFLLPNMILDSFEIRIIVYRQFGESENTIEAYLFWQHL